MDVSICIAAYNKPQHLDRVLQSIAAQNPPFEFETIVVDDGSPSGSIQQVCHKYNLKYLRVNRKPSYRNPSVARNIAYREARGEVIIAQSDDTIHVGNAIENLKNQLAPDTFVLANVVNVDWQYHPTPCHGNWTELVGPVGRERRPLFFLGALYREDLYKIGGNDERFTAPGCEDRWFAYCLTQGLGLKPVFSAEVKGSHLDHARPKELWKMTAPSRQLFQQLDKAGVYQTPSAPWPLVEVEAAP